MAWRNNNSDLYNNYQTSRDFHSEYKHNQPFFKSHEDYNNYVQTLNERLNLTRQENQRNAIKLTKLEFQISRYNEEATIKYGNQIFMLGNGYKKKTNPKDDLPFLHRAITDLFVIAAATLRHGSFPVILQRELMEHQFYVDMIEDKDIQQQYQRKISNLTASYHIPPEVWRNIWEYFFAMEPFICFKNSCRRIFFRKENNKNFCPHCHSPKLKTISITEL